MFFPEGQIRVFLYGAPVDMRNSFDGLYALGNTAANAFGAVYPGAGATIAQGLVYGYIAGRDAAGQL